MTGAGKEEEEDDDDDEEQSIASSGEGSCAGGTGSEASEISELTSSVEGGVSDDEMDEVDAGATTCSDSRAGSRAPGRGRLSS